MHTEMIIVVLTKLQGYTSARFGDYADGDPIHPIAGSDHYDSHQTRYVESSLFDEAVK